MVRVVALGTATLFTCLGLTACVAEVGEQETEDSPIEEEAPEQGKASGREQSVRFSRTDWTETLTPGNGTWGTWSTTYYCNEGAWAIGYQMRVEGNQGSGDDTALNAVRLQCATRTGATEWITPHSGIWGSWSPAVACTAQENFLTAVSLRVEGNRGDRRDDTGANDVSFGCLQGGSINAGTGMSWGDWGAWQECSAGSAVCGLSVRVEANQGSKRDDTAMNGLRIECCRM